MSIQLRIADRIYNLRDYQGLEYTEEMVDDYNFGRPERLKISTFYAVFKVGGEITKHPINRALGPVTSDIIRYVTRVLMQHEVKES